MVQPTSAEAQVLRHNPWYSQPENTQISFCVARRKLLTAFHNCAAGWRIFLCCLRQCVSRGLSRALLL